MSSNQNFWLDQLEKLGGQFWPPSKEEESEMPAVGAKFPMMLYSGGMEVIVLDEEEYGQAKKNGFNELHPEQAKSDQAAKPEPASSPSPPPFQSKSESPAAPIDTASRPAETPPKPAMPPPISKPAEAPPKTVSPPPKAPPPPPPKR